MKRFNIRIFLIVTLIVSCLLLYACGDGNRVETYEFTGLTTAYEVGDEFSIEGVEIVFRFSDKSTQKISIIAEMIKELPDVYAG